MILDRAFFLTRAAVLIMLLSLMAAVRPVSNAEPAPEPFSGPAVQIIPVSPEPVKPDPVPSPEIHTIENCTVTWYTADTCGKAPDHPAYGITASGEPVEEGVTCAVDPSVIPLGAEVRVLYADGSGETFRATDTGVKGEWVDIYTPDYDYAVQCGLQKLTVCWTPPER